MLGTQRSEQVLSLGFIERRHAPRFRLRLSCRLCLISLEKEEFAGTLINISRSGILVTLASAGLSRLPRPDEQVRLTVDLPRHPLFSPRCLECAARVVRVVAAQDKTHVAVEIGRMWVTSQSASTTSSGSWSGSPPSDLIQ